MCKCKENILNLSENNLDGFVDALISFQVSTFN